MGTSSGFLGVLNNTVAACGGGILAYGAIMGACIVGGIFESVLGAFLKPLRNFSRRSLPDRLLLQSDYHCLVLVSTISAEEAAKRTMVHFRICFWDL